MKVSTLYSALGTQKLNFKNQNDKSKSVIPFVFEQNEHTSVGVFEYYKRYKESFMASLNEKKKKYMSIWFCMMKRHHKKQTNCRI